MPEMEVTETFTAFGHINVRATHEATLEFTKDRHLSTNGDCIVAIASSKSVADLNGEFAERLRKPNARLTVLIEVGEIVDKIHAYGSPRLTLLHPKDIVIRKSDFVCSRTLAVRADKAAINLSRVLVKKLRNSKQEAKITLKIHS